MTEPATTTAATPPTTPESSTQPPAEPPADPPAAPSEPEGTENGSENGENGNSAASREAARYRTRLRETEAERDRATETLAGYQRREAERLAGEQLSNAGDLWLDGATVADVLDDDGMVDAERVTETLARVLEQRPQLSKSYRPGARDFGGGVRQTHHESGGGWSDVILNRH